MHLQLPDSTMQLQVELVCGPHQSAA
jgi:hypothetical protein